MPDNDIDTFLAATPKVELHAEVTVTPFMHTRVGLAHRELREGLAEGRARAAARGVDLAWIYDIPGQYGAEAAEHTLRCALDDPPAGLVAFGLAGAEAGVDRAAFGSAFATARSAPTTEQETHARQRHRHVPVWPVCPTPGRATGRRACGRRSATWPRPASATASGPSRTRRWSTTSPPTASRWRSARPPTSAPGSPRRSRPTRSGPCWRPASSSPSTPTTRPCSAPRSPRSTAGWRPRSASTWRRSPGWW